MGRGAGRLAGALSWHIKIRGTEPGTPRAGPRAWVVRTQGPTEPSAPSLALGGTRVRQAADRERTIVTMSALYGLPPAPPHVPSAGCTWEDRRQHRTIWVFALLSLAAAMGAALAWWAGAGVLLVAVVVWLGCLCGTYLLSMVRLSRCRARGRTAWTASPEGVRMLGSRELVAWGLALRLIAALVPLTVLAALLAGDHVPVLAGGLIGVLGLEVAFYLVRIVYRGGPVRPGILLSPMGVQVTRTDSSGDFLPWDREPRVTAVSGRVRIESQGRGPVQFSVWYLPVSYRQLERLLGALGNRPDMQARLGGPGALTMVLDLLEPTEEEYTELLLDLGAS